MADNSVDCCITSPPYFGLRDYCVDGQIGLEKSPNEYVAKMVKVTEELGIDIDFNELTKLELAIKPKITEAFDKLRKVITTPLEL